MNEVLNENGFPFRGQGGIYLDYNATTPCDPRVVDAMLPYFYEHPGNPASRTHAIGWRADEAVKKARKQIAHLTKVEAHEIIFTSGATESNNFALKGIYESYQHKGNHIITLTTEHKAVLDPLKKLETLGAEVTYLDVEPDGMVDLQKLENAITSQTLLIATMWANNETGVIQNMKAIGELCNQKNILLFSDATQAVGKIQTHPKELGVQLMSFSAHKMYGPKGVGALYVAHQDPKIKLAEQMNGGGHERGNRSGTLNVPGIVGFGKAAEIAQQEMEVDSARLQQLRDKFENTLLQQLELTSINGHSKNRLAHTCNMSFKFIDGEALMNTFNQRLAVASGSACTSASIEPSHVLLGMGLSKHLAQASLRFSLGKFTTEAEIDEAAAIIIANVNHQRALSPIWEMYKDGVDVEGLI